MDFEATITDGIISDSERVTLTKQKLLNCVENIEVRVSDRRGKLIATRQFSGDSSKRRRVRER
jgi:hypothetical protein